MILPVVSHATYPQHNPVFRTQDPGLNLTWSKCTLLLVYLEKEAVMSDAVVHCQKNSHDLATREVFSMTL